MNVEMYVKIYYLKPKRTPKCHSPFDVLDRSDKKILPRVGNTDLYCTVLYCTGGGPAPGAGGPGTGAGAGAGAGARRGSRWRGAGAGRTRGAWPRADAPGAGAGP